MAEIRLSGPITVTVLCRTSRTSTKGSKRHPVTLHPDGTIETPHDLEQERILAALGGYLSCLELADVATPAFLHWYALQQRLVPRPIRATSPRGPWHADNRADCCPRGGFKTPQEAAEHARTTRHVALNHGAHARQLAELARGVQESAPEMPGEPWTTLWECGMHPDEVDRISMDIDADDPLPVDFYLGVMCTEPELQWIRETAAEAELGERSMTCLAWSYGTSDRKHPKLRAEWLRAGVLDWLAVRLMRTPYGIDDVEAFAAHWGLSAWTAAHELFKWYDSGAVPRVADLISGQFDHLGYPPTPPRWQTRARLRDELDDEGCYSEEDLALAIARFGSVGRAARGLRPGLWP